MKMRYKGLYGVMITHYDGYTREVQSTGLAWWSQTGRDVDREVMWIDGSAAVPYTSPEWNEKDSVERERIYIGLGEAVPCIGVGCDVCKAYAVMYVGA